jgi:hypothetical protein
MAVKRRIVWLTDEEWEGIQGRAKTYGMTASAYIRSAAVGGHLIPLAIQADLAKIAGRAPEFRPVPKPSQKGK